MTSRAEVDEARVSDAVAAACVFAVDPLNSGLVVRSSAGATRDRWLSGLRSLVPVETPWRRVPCQVADERLLGGLDLAATLAAGRVVAERGLLAEVDGGVALFTMAERMAPSMVGRLIGVLDSHEVVVERDGLQSRSPARFGAVLLDEGCDADERVAPALAERAAMWLDLDGLRIDAEGRWPLSRTEVDAARAVLSTIRASDETLARLCVTAAAFGVASLRAPLQALRVARASAALAGRDRVDDDDEALAARLVIAPRATCLPPQESDAEDSDAPPEEPQPPRDPATESAADADDATPRREDERLDDRVLEATRAAIPADLLALLLGGSRPRAARAPAGGAGDSVAASHRGRPAGTRRGDPRGGARLDVLETLRAAAPWQRLRAAARAATRERGRIEVRRGDFRIKRFRERSTTTTIFAVDASGSTALHRLAEAKGAVELLLAQCYVRRDQVALLAFRGRTAEVLLPPTRSLVRAKRSLAGLPGGGGTPLAAGIAAASALADAIRRRGETAVVVLLTDGRANVTRDGKPGRDAAEADALAAAKNYCAGGYRTVLVDTSPQPSPRASRLAVALGAQYLALPHADARGVSAAVMAATSDARGRTAR